MATEKQIAANRRNAAKSTGPRTTLGKSRARMNALRHGLSYLGSDLHSIDVDSQAVTQSRQAAIIEALQQVRMERVRLIAETDDLISSRNVGLIGLALKKIAAITRYEGRLYSAHRPKTDELIAQASGSAKRTQFGRSNELAKSPIVR